MSLRTKKITILAFLSVMASFPLAGSSAEQDQTEEGFFSVDQQRLIMDWFAHTDQAWPKDGRWPALTNEVDVSRARAELWSMLRDFRKKDPAAKELGGLPPTLEEVIAQAKAGNKGLSPGALSLGEHTMPFVLLRKEAKPVPESGRALYICMHGGGQNRNADGPHTWSVNSREWRAQLGLATGVYAGEGIFFVPRMADDRLGRWWHGYVQDAIDEVIEHGLREWNVDPDRVYLMGVSEGCYGTQILGPFMADRFGGANAMAGGVGKDVPAENLRNLAFRTDVGENDTTFNRVGLAREFHQRMDNAKKQYGGYANQVNVQEGKGHGIDYAPGSEWMIGHQRNVRPDTVVWTSRPLGGNRRTAFYWLGLSGDKIGGRISMTARVEMKQNRVTLDVSMDEEKGDLADGLVRILLDEEMLDLSKPVEVTVNGVSVYEEIPKRNLETLARTLVERGDPTMAFPVEIVVDPKDGGTGQ